MHISSPRNLFSILFGSLLLLSLGACGGSSNSTVGSAPIDLSGGTVTSTDGRMSVTVPPGALNGIAYIEVENVNGVGGSTGAETYELTPDGQTFPLPVILAYTIPRSELVPGTLLGESINTANETPIAPIYIESSDGTVEEPTEISVTSTNGILSYETTTTHFSNIFFEALLRARNFSLVVEGGGSYQLGETFDVVTRVYVNNLPFRSGAGSTFTLLRSSNWTEQEISASLGAAGPPMTEAASTTSPAVLEVYRRTFRCDSAGTGTIQLRGDVILERTLEDGTPSFPSTHSLLESIAVTCLGAGGADEPEDEVSTPEGGESGGTIDIDISDTAVSFDHSVGSTECPQAIGSFSVTNTGTVPVEVSVSGGSAVNAILSGSSSLAPGESAEVLLEFNCNQNSDVNETVTVTATSEDGQSTQGGVMINGSVG